MEHVITIPSEVLKWADQNGVTGEALIDLINAFIKAQCRQTN